MAYNVSRYTDKDGYDVYGGSRTEQTGRRWVMNREGRKG